MADKFGVVAGENGKIYKMNPSNSEYDTEMSGIVTDEEMAGALADKADADHSHTFGGVNLDTSDEIKKITRLVIEDGIIKTFEYEGM